MAGRTSRAGRRTLIDRLARGEATIVTSLLDILAEAVTIRDRDGNIVYGNRAALATMGMSSVEELRGQDGGQIMERFTVEDEHGDPLGLNDLPGRKLLAGEEPEPLLMRVVERATGEAFWRLLKTTALRDRRGRFLGAMTVIEDVTLVKTAELRTRVLAESGRILASSLDYQQTLRNVAGVAVPSLADYCGVDLLDDHGRLERVAATHRDPAKRELAAGLQAVEPWTPSAENPSGHVLSTGTPRLFAEVSPEDLVTMGRGETHLRLIRELNVNSVLIVPMLVPTRTVGLLTLATDASRGRRLGEEDVELAEQLARRAAVAVENSRLHTKLANVAETLQQSLRPRELPQIRGWELASLYVPAQVEHQIDVGGDFYELYEQDGTWFVIVGDVTGKGVAAASMTALMRNGARVASRTEPRPAAILARLDEVLKQQAEPSLCTALCLAIHGSDVVLSSAGHPPALLLGRDGAVRQAPAPGPLLGAFADATWGEERIEVSDGELLLLYTDGVTETAGESERFGVERLRWLLAAHAGAGPAELLAVLEATLTTFRHGPERDDVAALALRARSTGGR